MLRINYVKPTIPAQGALLLTVAANRKLGPRGNEIDRKLGGAIKRAMASGKFEGKKEQVLVIPAPAKTRLNRVVLLGIGEPSELTDVICQKAGGAAIVVLQKGNEATATLIFDDYKGMAVDVVTAAANTAFGAKLRSYKFDKYFTKLKDDKKSKLAALDVAGEVSALKKAYSNLEKIADGVFFARDLINEPANVIYPETLANECKKLSKLGIKVEVLDEKAMKKLGMGSLLAVSQGSGFPPCLVAMYWQGNPKAKDKRPLALLGKGVTYDTGGLCLKPRGALDDMKRDMTGAAIIMGTMMILASRKAKVNAVGVVGLTENVIDGLSMRVGDIVKSMSGQTIEITNTDAEGRLVLADAIWYAQDKYKPHSIVDVATLAGAVKMALGNEFGGLFDNDESLRTRLMRSGQSVDENLWPLPLCGAFDKAMDSSIADMKNASDISAGAGGSMGAQFIKRFVKEGTSWAHLDIAPVSFSNKDQPLSPKGATAFGIRLLERFVADYYEAE